MKHAVIKNGRMEYQCSNYLISYRKKWKRVLTSSKNIPHLKAFLMFSTSQHAGRPEDWYPDARISISTNPLIRTKRSSKEKSGWDQPISPRMRDSYCNAYASTTIHASRKRFEPSTPVHRKLRRRNKWRTPTLYNCELHSITRCFNKCSPNCEGDAAMQRSRLSAASTGAFCGARSQSN